MANDYTLYFVIDYRDGREVGINFDGTTSPIEQAENYLSSQEAKLVADRFGGKVQREVDIFG